MKVKVIFSASLFFTIGIVFVLGIVCASASPLNDGLLSAEARKHPIVVLANEGPNVAWTQLQQTIGNTTNAGPYLPGFWLEVSLDIYSNSQELHLKDLVKLWQQIQSKNNMTHFAKLDFQAYLDSANRLATFAENPDIQSAHKLLQRSIVDFPDEQRTELYWHQRDAQFSLMEAVYSHCALVTITPEKPYNPEWLYLAGRSLQIIKRGGSEQLRDFIEKTKGRSAYARPALAALTKALRDDVDPRDSPEKLPPPADLLALIEAAEHQPSVKTQPKIKDLHE